MVALRLAVLSNQFFQYGQQGRFTEFETILSHRFSKADIDVLRPAIEHGCRDLAGHDYTRAAAMLCRRHIIAGTRPNSISEPFLNMLQPLMLDMVKFSDPKSYVQMFSALQVCDFLSINASPPQRQAVEYYRAGIIKYMTQHKPVKTLEHLADNIITEHLPKNWRKTQLNLWGDVLNSYSQRDKKEARGYLIKQRNKLHDTQDIRWHAPFYFTEANPHDKAHLEIIFEVQIKNGESYDSVMDFKLRLNYLHNRLFLQPHYMPYTL